MIFVKALAVVNSCKTPGHVMVAMAYLDQAMKVKKLKYSSALPLVRYLMKKLGEME